MDRKTFRTIAEIAINAGKAILKVYTSEDFGIEIKKDSSPLTLADSHSHETLVKGLSQLKIEGELLPLISEEGNEPPYNERTNWKRYWLIDPLDGTKEFIKKNGEFTVNIALIEEGLPIAGFVYIPVSNTLYCGCNNLGSFKLVEASKNIGSSVFAPAKRLQVHKYITGTVKVVASRSHVTPETENFILKLKKQFKNISLVSSGSSIKLCMIADNTAHMYPRFAPTMEWDTAAAHAVCRYAGATVLDYETKKEMKYNKKTLLNNWFLVYGSNQFEELT